MIVKLIFVIAGVTFVILVNKLFKKYWKHTGAMFFLVNLIKENGKEV